MRSWPILDDRLIALPRSARGLPCRRIAQSALDEVGETIAFLEDMPLRRAVKRLKLVRDDLERLVVSCRPGREANRATPHGQVFLTKRIHTRLRSAHDRRTEPD